MPPLPRLADDALPAPASLHDLAALADELGHAARCHPHGHQALTVVRQPDLRVVLLALRAGARVDDHAAPCAASIHVVRGSVRMHLDGRDLRLDQGQLLALDRDVTHDVEAVDDSVLLITLAWRPATDRAAAPHAARRAR